MAKETIEVEIKGNTKSATKDVKEYVMTLDEINAKVKEQKQILHELKGEEIKLKQARAGMNDYERSLTGIDKKIEHISLSIKDQTHAVKGLTDQQKEATKAEKENNKEAKESIANLQFMGVSLNGIKKGFSQIIPTARAMFGTIKAGIMSTGIGALIIAVTSLMAAFKRSEKGQEKFQRIMAGIGAVVNQVMDLFADLGGVIVNAFENPKEAVLGLWNALKTNIVNRITGIVDLFVGLGTVIKGALDLDLDAVKKGAAEIGESYTQVLTGVDDLFGKATKSVSEFVKETVKEVEAIDRVTKKRQQAHHIDRKLKVERAKADREINDIRLQAEDRENKSATERIALLRRAQEIEEGITNKEIQSKKILIEAQKLEMAQGKNTIEDKDKLAQLQAELIQLDTKKLRSQRLLQTQITTAVNEEKAQKEEDKKQKDADIKEAEDRAKKEAEILLALQQENTLALIEDMHTRALAELKIQEDKELASAELLENSELVKDEIRKKFARQRGVIEQKQADDEIKLEKQVLDAKKGLGKQGLKLVETLAGEGSAVGKAAAIASATMSGVESVQNAFTTAQKSPITVGFPAYPFVQAGLAGAFSAVQLAKIVSGGGGGASGGGGGGGAAAAAAAPAPQMMSGAFELSGVSEPEPVKAFVVTDEMTSSQNQLANIRRRATI